MLQLTDFTLLSQPIILTRARNIGNRPVLRLNPLSLQLRPFRVGIHRVIEIIGIVFKELNMISAHAAPLAVVHDGAVFLNPVWEGAVNDFVDAGTLPILLSPVRFAVTDVVVTY